MLGSQIRFVVNQRDYFLWKEEKLMNYFLFFQGVDLEDDLLVKMVVFNDDVFIWG